MEEIQGSRHEKQSKSSKGFEDFLITIVKWKKIIFWNTFVFTILAIVVSLFMDKWYTSTASVLPPQKKGGLFGDIAGFSSAIKDISKTIGRLGNTSEEAYSYLAILQSRTASEDMIKEFNLRKVYKVKPSVPEEDVIDDLKNNVDFNVQDEGNITIKVTDKDPQRAADMANYYVKILNDVSISLGTKEAENNRKFLEQRVNQVNNSLRSCEDSLEEFSAKYHVYEIDEQTKAAIKVASDLMSQIEISEIELSILKKNYGNNSPALSASELKIDKLKSSLKGLDYGTNLDKNDKNIGLFVPFKEIPEVGMQYVRLKRDFEIQTQILEFLYPLYEQAKIDEQKDIPVVLSLDKAVPAERKSSPKRAIIVAVTFLLSLFLSIIWVLILEYFANLKMEKEKFEKINNGILIPLRNIFRFKSSKKLIS